MRLITSDICGSGDKVRDPCILNLDTNSAERRTSHSSCFNLRQGSATYSIAKWWVSQSARAWCWHNDTYTYWDSNPCLSSCNLVNLRYPGSLPTLCRYIWFSEALELKSSSVCLFLDVSRSHEIRQTLKRTPLNEWSARRRGRYLHDTQQTQETKIHSLSGFPNRDPNNRAVSSPLLRPHDHRYIHGQICY